TSRYPRRCPPVARYATWTSSAAMSPASWKAAKSEPDAVPGPRDAAVHHRWFRRAGAPQRADRVNERRDDAERVQPRPRHLRTHGNIDGLVFAFFVMVIAAAEVVVGLAIIVMIFRTRRSASVDDESLLKL